MNKSDDKTGISVERSLLGDLVAPNFDPTQVCISPRTDWAYLRSVALYHRVANLAAYNLSQLPTGRLDTAIICDWGEMLSRTRVEQSAFQHAFQTLFACMDEGAVPYAVMKGIAIAHMAYPDPVARPFRDLDLLVPRAFHGKAYEVLRACGFQQVRFDPERKTFVPVSAQDIAGFSVFQHSCPFLGPERAQYRVDLHWTLAGFFDEYRLDIDSIVADRKEMHSEVLSFWTLSAEDMLLTHCLHTHNHVDFRLKFVSDVAHILHRLGPKMQWELFLGRLANQAVRNDVSYFLELVGRFFPFLLRTVNVKDVAGTLDPEKRHLLSLQTRALPLREREASCQSAWGPVPSRNKPWRYRYVQGTISHTHFNQAWWRFGLFLRVDLPVAGDQRLAALSRKYLRDEPTLECFINPMRMRYRKIQRSFLITNSHLTPQDDLVYHGEYFGRSGLEICHVLRCYPSYTAVETQLRNVGPRLLSAVSLLLDIYCQDIWSKGEEFFYFKNSDCFEKVQSRQGLSHTFRYNKTNGMTLLMANHTMGSGFGMIVYGQNIDTAEVGWYAEKVTRFRTCPCDLQPGGSCSSSVLILVGRFDLSDLCCDKCIRTG